MEVEALEYGYHLKQLELPRLLVIFISIVKRRAMCSITLQPFNKVQQNHLKASQAGDTRGDQGFPGLPKLSGADSCSA